MTTESAMRHDETREPVWPVAMGVCFSLSIAAGMAARLLWAGPVGSITAAALALGGAVLVASVAALVIRRTRHWIIRQRMRLATVLGSVIVALGLAEAALRIVDPIYEAPWETDAALGWAPKRNLRTHWCDPDTRRPQLTITDENGFRNPPLRPNTRKIALVGDSMTFGIMAPQDAIVSIKLAERLGPKYQVINASAGGWGTDQELIFFRERVLKHRPETVIWVVSPGNDVVNNMIDHMFFWRETPKPHYALEDGALVLHEIPTQRLPVEVADAFYSVRLVKVIRRAACALRTRSMITLVDEKTVYPEDVQNDYSHYCILANDPSPGFRAGMSLTAALLREAKATAREAGMRTLFVAFDPQKRGNGAPDLGVAARHYGWDAGLLSFEAGRRNVDAIAAEAGIDLYLYAAPPGGRFKTDAHLSARGHAHFADYLHQLLHGELRPTFAYGSTRPLPRDAAAQAQ